MGGLRNMPVTVLQAAPLPTRPQDEPDKAAAQVKASSEESIAKAKQDDETRESSIHVESRAADPRDLEKAIRAEAEKGHDLLFAGLDTGNSEADPYGVLIKSALDAFQGSAAILSARTTLRRNPDTGLRMLVPVGGDNRSMRSVELASVIAKASGGRVGAIYVPPDDESSSRSPAQVENIFAHVQEIGRHYDINIRAVTGRAGQRELSILTRARAGRYNLIVLGVGRRAGDVLSFGSLADNLLQMSDRSLMFFVTS
jgi:nucleotide-binding universal stress UspA family protein